MLLESYDSLITKHFTYFAKFVTLIQRSPTARARVCVCFCVLFIDVDKRRPRPHLGCSATTKENFSGVYNL